MHTIHEHIENINVSEFWKSFIDDEYLIVSPDGGAISRNKSLYHLSLLKERQKNRVIITGPKDLSAIKNKSCMIVDDMIDTGETAIATSDCLIENGARSVNVCATHAVLSGDAIQRIQNSKNIEKINITDTINHRNLPDKYLIVPIFKYVFDHFKNI
jgi:ribose-phosphate pyrophosphokinase